MSKIQRPYCRIDGIPYGLEMVDDVLRFPNLTTKDLDVNHAWIDYQEKRLDLDVLFTFYTTTGCSYGFVQQYFGKSPHNDLVEKHEQKSFRLYC